MQLLIATHNPAKFQRYQQLLETIPGIEPVSLSHLGIIEKAEEPFMTAKENAFHKVKIYADLANMPTLAIDESVMTNFLPENEQPGVYVRRFADKEHEMSDEEALTIWRRIIDVSPQPDKQFTWDYSIAYFDPQYDRIHYTKAVNVTRVAEEFSSTVIPGYPMSSFMIYQGSDRPNADYTDAERFKIDQGIFDDFLTQFQEWIS